MPAAVPLYRQVQDGIEQLIRSDAGRQAIALSDAALAERFGVSRITVRRAVDQLVDAGVLYRIQGRGTFVRPRKVRERLTLNSFLDAWTHQTGRFDVRVGRLARVRADDDAADQLKVSRGDEVIYVQRLRFQKKVLVAQDDRYLRPEYCLRLTRQDIETCSLVDYLRDREGVGFDHGEMEIEARTARTIEAKALKIRTGEPVLVRRVVFFSTKGEPVLAGTSIYRADRVTYRLSLWPETDGAVACALP